MLLPTTIKALISENACKSAEQVVRVEVDERAKQSVDSASRFLDKWSKLRVMKAGSISVLYYVVFSQFSLPRLEQMSAHMDNQWQRLAALVEKLALHLEVHGSALGTVSGKLHEIARAFDAQTYKDTHIDYAIHPSYPSSYIQPARHYNFRVFCTDCSFVCSKVLALRQMSSRCL